MILAATSLADGRITSSEPSVETGGHWAIVSLQTGPPYYLFFWRCAFFEQRVTGVISLSEFELSKLKVYKVERSIYPSIFRIKQRVQPLCLDLFILREIDWKGRVQV